MVRGNARLLFLFAVWSLPGRRGKRDFNIFQEVKEEARVQVRK